MMIMLKQHFCIVLLQMHFWSHLLAATEQSGAVYTGVPGIPGHNGTSGRDGKDGLGGQKGQKGDPGISVQGTPGKMGPQGSIGPKGEKGNTGQTGTGVQGPPGKTGPAGPIGLKGEKGNTGQQGIGVQGPPGKTGQAGPIGLKGEKGNLGQPGAAGDVSSITSLESEYKKIIKIADDAISASVQSSKNLQSVVKRLTDRLSGIEKASRFKIFKNVGGKYYVSDGQTANFDDGLKFCKDVGGTIVLPTNEDENELLTSMHAVLGSTNIMIGTTDKKKEGRFLDMNDKPLSYSKWGTNEPNNYGGEEDCAVLYTDGKWSDVRCDSKCHVVCEL